MAEDSEKMNNYTASKLNAAVLSIHQSLDLNTILKLILEGACSLIDKSQGAVLLFDDSGHLNELVAQRIIVEDSSAFANFRELSMQLSKESWGWPGVTKDPDIIDCSALVPSMTGQIVPLCNGDTLLGGIYLQCSDGNPIHDGYDKECLQILATHAGLSITNALKHDRTKYTQSQTERILRGIPVGVLVFDAETGNLLKNNTEAVDLVHGLHSNAAPLKRFRIGDLSINFNERSVELAGRPLRLTPIEYRLLSELASNAGRSVPYSRLNQKVWGFDSPDRRPLRTVVKSLRRKLGDDAKNPRYIFTDSRYGYGLTGSVKS